VQREDFVLVIDNASDFRPMYARDELHPGLIVMPAGHGRDRQRQLASKVVDWIANTASTKNQTPQSS
jgi:hypothetical protein